MRSGYEKDSVSSSHIYSTGSVSRKPQGSFSPISFQREDLGKTQARCGGEILSKSNLCPQHL